MTLSRPDLMTPPLRCGRGPTVLAILLILTNTAAYSSEAARRCCVEISYIQTLPSERQKAFEKAFGLRQVRTSRTTNRAESQGPALRYSAPTSDVTFFARALREHPEVVAATSVGATDRVVREESNDRLLRYRTLNESFESLAHAKADLQNSAAATCADCVMRIHVDLNEFLKNPDAYLLEYYVNFRYHLKAAKFIETSRPADQVLHWEIWLRGQVLPPHNYWEKLDIEILFYWKTKQPTFHIEMSAQGYYTNAAKPSTAAFSPNNMEDDQSYRKDLSTYVDALMFGLSNYIEKGQIIP